MKPWIFLAFESEMGVRYLDEWFDRLGEESENEFMAKLESLQVTPRHLWQRPQFDMLSGERYRGIGEIRFRGDRKQHRVFGYFGPKPGQFTMLHACVKQRRQVTDDMNLAAKRKKLLELGKAKIYEFTVERNPDQETQ